MQEKEALVRLNGGGIGWNIASPQIIWKVFFYGEWPTQGTLEFVQTMGRNLLTPHQRPSTTLPFGPRLLGKNKKPFSSHFHLLQWQPPLLQQFWKQNSYLSSIRTSAKALMYLPPQTHPDFYFSSQHWPIFFPNPFNTHNPPLTNKQFKITLFITTNPFGK